MEDCEIICLFWERDELAIKHTEVKYGGKLYHLAMRILNNREDTAECINDTLLKTWNTIPPQKPTYFFAYIAKNCRYISFGMLDWKNAKKRKAEIVELTNEMQSCIPDSLSNVDREIESKVKTTLFRTRNELEIFLRTEGITL